jgi:hypothetical protein
MDTEREFGISGIAFGHYLQYATFNIRIGTTLEKFLAGSKPRTCHRCEKITFSDWPLTFSGGRTRIWDPDRIKISGSESDKQVRIKLDPDP